MTPRPGLRSPPLAAHLPVAAARDVVALFGGLGNQLFQVAFGRWLKQRTGRETWYDASFRRDLAFDVLELPGIGAAVRERILTSTCRLPTPDGRVPAIGRLARAALGPRRLVRDYSGPGPELPERPDAAWWFGYWQRRAWADVLLPELKAVLPGGDSGAQQPVIGVHVRRGDMLSTPSTVPAAWLARALEQLRAELGDPGIALSVRVWSDNPDWCREELDLGAPFDVVPRASAVEHLTGLSSCSALVLSRSTFSWWAARIATERGATVVFPTPWWTDTPELEETIVHESWLPLAVDAAPSRLRSAVA